MRFLCFGEILFDVFGSSEKLGGAPLNVAAHLSRLGGTGAVLSAVGSDRLGRSALAQIKALGLDTSLIGTSSYGTGRADVTLDSSGSADYVFNDPCAWDDIRMPSLPEASCDLFYFGALAQRGATSRATLKKILNTVPFKEVFFDVNIRKHFYTADILADSIASSTMLKMNEVESPLIARELGLDASSHAKTASALFEKYPRLKIVLVTLGAEGSECFTREGNHLRQECGKVTVVDTVGAGDALSAGFLTVILKGESVRKALSVGTSLASFVVGCRGAIPPYTKALTDSLRAEGIPC